MSGGTYKMHTLGSTGGKYQAQSLEAGVEMMHRFGLIYDVNQR